LQNGAACKVAKRNTQRNLFLEESNIRTLSNKINRPSWEQNRQACQRMQGRNKVLPKNTVII